MSKRSILLTIIVLVFLSGCSERAKHVVGNYYIESVDLDVSLGYKVDDDSYLGLVEYISEIYHTDHYIVVKGRKRDSSGFADSTRKYYIVTVYNHQTYSPDSGITGPFLGNELDAECRKIGIPENIKLESVK